MITRVINDNNRHTKVRFNLSPDWHGALTEDLYVESLEGFPLIGKVKSIPFFVKDISVDDIVEYEEKEGFNFFVQLVRKSDFSSYIIFFKDDNKEFIEMITNQIEITGIEFEKSNRFYGLCSVCIKNLEELDKFDNIIGKYIDKKIDIQTNSYRFL